MEGMKQDNLALEGSKLTPRQPEGRRQCWLLLAAG